MAVHPPELVELQDNTPLGRGLLVGLRERGLEVTRPILAVLVGVKSLGNRGEEQRRAGAVPVIAKGWRFGCRAAGPVRLLDSHPRRFRPPLEAPDLSDLGSPKNESERN